MLTGGGSLARRVLVSILVLGLLAAPVSAVFAQGMIMGPVSATQHPALGLILADANGMTLYTWEGDTALTSNCYDDCARAWPPLLVDEATAAGVMSMMMGGFGAAQRSDGSYQVTYSGWPFYDFSRDTAPGDALGVGLRGFGALWSVVSLDPMMMEGH